MAMHRKWAACFFNNHYSIFNNLLFLKMFQSVHIAAMLVRFAPKRYKVRWKCLPKSLVLKYSWIRVTRKKPFDVNTHHYKWPGTGREHATITYLQWRWEYRKWNLTQHIWVIAWHEHANDGGTPIFRAQCWQLKPVTRPGLPAEVAPQEEQQVRKVSIAVIT